MASMFLIQTLLKDRNDDDDEVLAWRSAPPSQYLLNQAEGRAFANI